MQLGWPDVHPSVAASVHAPGYKLAVLTSHACSTNSSYQRWDEARKMWGSMVNRSRDFTRQALGYVPESQPELRSMLVRWSITYP
jgi:predicted membrane chloride channel (bestrophin family)